MLPTGSKNLKDTNPGMLQEAESYLFFLGKDLRCPISLIAGTTGLSKVDLLSAQCQQTHLTYHP